MTHVRNAARTKPSETLHMWSEFLLFLLIVLQVVHQHRLSLAWGRERLTLINRLTSDSTQEFLAVQRATVPNVRPKKKRDVNEAPSLPYGL